MIYESIDVKEKEVNVIIEKVLEEIFLEVFVVVKEIVRCWVVNGKLMVIVMELDKDFVVKKDGIIIEGD